MAETDVDSVVAGGTGTDQKRHGSHKEHYSKLLASFKELEELGAADGPRFRSLVFTLLKAFEGMRVEQDSQIRRLERQIEYCRAKQRSCSEFSNLLVGMLATQVQEAKTAQAPSEPSAPGAISDKELLKTICICGCQDAEDEADCNCSCHKGSPCSDERCTVCQAKRRLRVAETAGRRKAPVGKKTRKKKTKKTKE